MIAVNGRFMLQETTGVQRYAAEVCNAFAKRATEFVVYRPPGQVLTPIDSNIDVRVVGRFGGHLWEQTELPHVVRKSRNGPLLNLANTAPIAIKKQLVVLHDINFVTNPDAYSLKFRIYYRLLTKALAARGVRFATVSEVSKVSIVDHYKLAADDVVLAGNAATQLVQELQEPVGIISKITSPYFLVVGSNSRHKNVGFAIEAFSVYNSRYPGRVLAIAGGTHRSFQFAEQTESHQDVIRLGRVTDAELDSLYRSAEALIFPSLQEGFGIPPIEALARGCPVLASDIPVLREVLGDTAAYFNPREVEDLVRSLVAVSEDPSERARLSRLGRTNADRFSWEGTAAGLIGGVEPND